jgi:hypothetical protein
MACILRISGETLAIDELLVSVPLKPCSIYRKGQPTSTRPNARNAMTSGMNIVVSEADFDAFKTQLAESEAFLQSNYDSLQKLVNWPGVEEMRLDFGIEMRNVYSQCDYFPASLVKLAGSLGLGLELSQYPTNVRKKIKNNRRMFRKNR